MYWEKIMWNRGRRGRGKNRPRAGPCLLPSQKKLIELQAGKKSLEDQVEVLRTLKEEAEKPEEAAKEQHRRLWEGTSEVEAGASSSPPGKGCLIPSPA